MSSSFFPATPVKPTQVSIISHTSSPLKSGKKYDVICQSKGSKPPATISWYLRHKLLKTSRSSDSPDGKITTSVLNYVATAEDHGQLIVCMASNPRDSISHLNDTLLLDIHYRPKLSLRMATNDTNGTTPGATAYPLEGQEAILNCDTKSNPNATQMYWLHNGLPVRADKDSGLFVNGQQLVLRTVLRSVHNGDYQCVASNSEGTARSNILTLSVHYAPTCEEKNKKVYYEISPGEPLTIACAMRASHGVNFSWTYQPIGETKSRRLTNFTIQNGLQGDSSIFVSSLLVSIDHEADYGKYVCLSRNNYGQGSCEYLLQPKLGPPEAPSACHLSVQVQDGGQVIHMVTCDTYNSTDPLDKISYHLEVFDAERKVLLKEVDNLSDPHFLISGLSAEDKHVFVISSRDDNGHSKEYILSTSTAKSLVSTTHAHDGQDGNHRNDNETGSTLDSHLLVLVVVGGLLLTLTMLAIIKVTLVCQHKNIISSQRNGNNHDGHPSSESLNKSMNPDVIPLNIESLAALGLPADYSADYSILTNGQRYDVSTIQWLPDDNDDHIIDQSEMQIKNYISAAVDKTQLHENYDLFEDTIFITEEYVDNSQVLKRRGKGKEDDDFEFNNRRQNSSSYSETASSYIL
ncbi:Cell adhesion molecule 2 [Halotydeus destructor]|nr:Cell adhesion molecule 2 [Halotydeus destructor]